MRPGIQREAIQTYELAKALLAEQNVDSLMLEARLTIKRQGNVLAITLRAYGQDTLVLVGVAGDPPEFTHYRGGAWKKILQRA